MKRILVTKEKDLAYLSQRWLNEAEYLGIDTETDGLLWYKNKIVGISISHTPGIGYYIPVDVKRAKSLFDFQKPLPKDIIIEYLSPLIKSDKPIFMHNAKFDMHFLREFGFDLGPNILDTMLLAFVLFNKDGERYKLKTLVKKHLGVQMLELKDIGFKSKESFADVPLDLATEYAAADADMTLSLGLHLEKLLDDKSRFIWNLENQVNYVLMDMEKEGISVDLKKVQELKEGVSAEIEEVLSKISAWTTKDVLDSPKKLSHFLFQELQLNSGTLKPGKSGYLPTSKNVLIYLKNDHEIIPCILKYRALTKLLGTYYDPIPKMISPKTGKIHTEFSSLISAEREDGTGRGVTSGRLSSDNPNLQNIPPFARVMFIADPSYYLVSIDFSQQEVRFLAILGNDEKLLEGFKKGDVDAHIEVASMLNPEHNKEEMYLAYEKEDHPDHSFFKKLRAIAKTYNFGIPYGLTIFGFADRFGCSVDEARVMVDQYYQTFPGIKNYVFSTKAFLLQNGFVETIWGRKRYFEIPEDEYRREKILREAINMPIQGSAADQMKIAMVNCHKFLKPYKSKMLVQIHDEILFTIEESETELIGKLKQIMENSVSLSIPFVCDVEIGQNWAEMIKYNKEKD